jgi:VanZ family protein
MYIESSLQHLILGLLMAMAYPTLKRFKYPYLILLLAHPFIIEGVQLFMPDRTADTADILFGLIGTLLGFCLV